MNIYDIADKAGVSIATVSRVLNNSTNVSQKTRQKVLDVMETLGYTPNAFARGLNLNTMKMIGVLCTDVSDVFYAKAVSVIENSLRQHGFDAILCCTGDNIEDKKKYMNLLLEKRVDALILVGSTFKEKLDNSHIEKIASSIPVIIINGLITLPNTYCILSDEFQAIYDNVVRLCHKGYENVLYLYDVDTFSGSQKLNGYKNAIKDCGLTINNDLIIKVPKDLNDIKEALSNLLKKGIVPSAVLASEDILAIFAMKSLTEKGYTIPKDIPIIGFNNSLLAECSTPSLTSIDNMVGNLCTTAVTTLTNVFSGEDVPHKITISCKLVERDTFIP
ncbi:MAG: transcriptional regulator, LacI family [Clostridia bacterium]|jgi:LacI family transcriptional regulator/LacI family asc operon transcriptional repressor|nr:transcriptional regulator, LacI family [Clostridia bacterium]